MAQLLKNNVSGVLSSQITAAATSMTLVDASLFPAPSGSDFYLLTLIGLNVNGNESSWEIVKVTAKASNTLTIVRAQEGTSAAAWPAATVVQLRLTAGSVTTQTDLAAHTSSTANPHNVTKTQVGLGNVDNTSDASKPVSTATQTALNAKQDVLVSGTSIKTINSTSLLGSGDVSVVVGPASSTSGNIATFNGTTGKLLQDGGKALPTGAIVGVSDSQTLTNKTLTGLRETKVAMAANNIDLSTANYFTKTISTATTLTVSNVPATGTTSSFILELTNGGSATVNWWSGMTWAGGTAPTLTAAGVDILGFYTHDGGTTWRGLVLATDIKAA